MVNSNNSEWTNVGHTCFEGPRPPALDLDSLADSVLMPDNFPVRAWVLVEKDASHRKAPRLWHRRNRFPDILRCCEPWAQLGPKATTRDQNQNWETAYSQWFKCLRASANLSEGCRFNSCRAYHSDPAGRKPEPLPSEFW
jgi:hypothetical protein